MKTYNTEIVTLVPAPFCKDTLSCRVKFEDRAIEVAVHYEPNQFIVALQNESRAYCVISNTARIVTAKDANLRPLNGLVLILVGAFTKRRYEEFMGTN